MEPMSTVHAAAWRGEGAEGLKDKKDAEDVKGGGVG